jgi:benzoyl-CoA reductase subunit C
VDDLLKGKLHFLDGILTYETCIQARTLMLIMEKNAPMSFMEALFLPNQLANPLTRPYLVETLQSLKERLEKFAGHEIKSETLWGSISLYNKNRGLLREVYELRKRRPGVIALREMVPIVHSSMLMLKEAHNEALEKLIPDLERRPDGTNVGPKVVLVGSLCTAPSAEFLKLLDDSGMVVVDDDLYTGSRYFVNDVASDGDPLGALADRFLTRVPPCPTKLDPETDWSDYIIDKVRSSGAQGVITLIQKNCPPHMCYSPDVMRRLSQAGIPELVLEVEHEVVSLEQIRTRLQALKETLGGL